MTFKYYLHAAMHGRIYYHISEICLS